MTTDTATALRGIDVVTPSDAGWDEARRAWNLAVDQRPEVVVQPATAEQVAAAVRHARDAGLRVAAQATGHGASARGSLEGAMLLSTSRMREVTVDAQARTARAAGGALWEDVIPPAAEHGLAALHGSAPDVGVVGYTLGGGVGWLGRRHGLAASSVTAVELVTPAGDLVRADAQSEPDLFWALRGGGGGFGVVTAIEFSLYPLESVNAGWLVWPWEEARRVLTAWAEWTESVPEEVSSVGRLLQVPPLPEVPEPVRGRQLVIVEAAIMAGEDDARRLLAPLRELAPEMDTFAQQPPAGLAGLHMDPPEPVPGIGDGSLIDAFTPDAVDALLAVAGPGTGSPLLSVEFRHLGGALERSAEAGGALDRVDGRFLMYAVAVLMDPAMAGPLTEEVARANDAMAPWGRGRRFLNFADAPADTATMFSPEAFARLRQIRAAADPQRMLQPKGAIPDAA
jgi:FAD/FMN-containing dehydrogenase